MKNIFFISILTMSIVSQLKAQKTHSIPSRSITLYADEIKFGDCDLYGKGYWRAEFKMRLQGRRLILTGNIKFTETYGDRTIISKAYSEEYDISNFIEEYEPSMSISLTENYGSVSGERLTTTPRIYSGNGLIKEANIVSDAAGCDDGKVGGEITFREVVLIVK